MLAQPNQGVSLWACYIKCSLSTSGGIRQTGWSHRSSGGCLFSCSCPAALSLSKTSDRHRLHWQTSLWCHSWVLFPFPFKWIRASYSVNWDELNKKPRLILSSRDQYDEACGSQTDKGANICVVLRWTWLCASLICVRKKEEERERVNKLMCQPFASIDCCH